MVAHSAVVASVIHAIADMAGHGDAVTVQTFTEAVRTPEAARAVMT